MTPALGGDWKRAVMWALLIGSANRIWGFTVRYEIGLALYLASAVFIVLVQRGGRHRSDVVAAGGAWLLLLFAALVILWIRARWAPPLVWETPRANGGRKATTSAP